MCLYHLSPSFAAAGIGIALLCFQLTGFVQKELIKDLLKECAKMYEFDHPNVLKLSGVCLDGGPAPYIIMPFMENGSLLSYLKEERETIVLDPKSTSSEDAVSRLIDMQHAFIKD